MLVFSNQFTLATLRHYVPTAAAVVTKGPRLPGRKCAGRRMIGSRILAATKLEHTSLLHSTSRSSLVYWQGDACNVNLHRGQQHRSVISKVHGDQQLQSSLFHTQKTPPSSSQYTTTNNNFDRNEPPGSKAFADSELVAVADLFYKFSTGTTGGVDDLGTYLCLQGVRELLASIGEHPDDVTLGDLFGTADLNDDGKLHLDEFLMAADNVLGGAPARIVLVVGGPGSGKGILCRRLSEECGVVHLSCGDLLRDEVTQDTPLGKDVAGIMSRGELVSSAVIVSLLRRRMRAYPGRRVLLDGFPRSLQNALDFAELCGKPELALNLYCDDTILMERILNRAKESAREGGNVSRREDDTIETALKRLRTFHKSQRPTLEWLRDNHVPVINLDCSGSQESVWEQLLAIGRLMRPAAQIRDADITKASELAMSGLLRETMTSRSTSSSSSSSSCPPSAEAV